MAPVEQPPPIFPSTRASAFKRAHRLIPLAVIGLAMAAVFATGAYRHVSLETLVENRMAIDAFIAAHGVAAVAVYVLIYVTAVALSIPGSLFLTIAGGIMFGTLLGGLAAVFGATIGATIIFLIARSACGETLVRRAGPLATKIADGFCADAFSYLLFLRLVPAFPFFLVNLAPALVGVKLRTFVIATAIGIVPATFAFAFFGDGLDSALAAQAAAYRDCITSGGADCRLHFDLAMIATPRLLAAFATLGVLALIPVAVRRLRARAVSPASAAPDRPAQVS
jgi:uncharacterized membrane protein YdjX (TVP38/TMEM64 family)